MKSALTLFSLSVLCGSAHNLYQTAMVTVTPLPGFVKARLSAYPLPIPHLLDIVRLTAKKHGVDSTLVKSIIKAESAFRTGAVSPKGALGLMQLMPETAAEYGVTDPRSPEQNIDAGTKYLGWLVHRYQNHKNGLPLAIAAYNAGPGNVDRYNGIPPFSETRNYVSRVLNYQREFVGLPLLTATPVVTKTPRRVSGIVWSRHTPNS